MGAANIFFRGFADSSGSARHKNSGHAATTLMKRSEKNRVLGRPGPALFVLSRLQVYDGKLHGWNTS